MTDAEVVQEVKRRLNVRLARDRRRVRAAMARHAASTEIRDAEDVAAVDAAESAAAATKTARHFARRCQTTVDLLSCGNTIVWDTTHAVISS